MTLGQKLRDLRRRCVWSVDRLAKASGVNNVAIRLYESNHRQPSVDTLRALCNALGVKLDVFHDCEPLLDKRRFKVQT